MTLLLQQEERERELEFRGLLRTEEKVIVTLHPRVMTLRKDNNKELKMVKLGDPQGQKERQWHRG